MLKYKILIKLFVLNCVFVFRVYGDTIHTEVVVFCPADIMLWFLVMTMNAWS
jgi:hypothetical protein